MKNKGFTLVELMAVIILIGLIGLISVPAINRTLLKQKTRSFATSVRGMMNSAAADAENDKFKYPRVYIYEDQVFSLIQVRGVITNQDLQVGGKIINGTGTIKYDENGNMFVSIKSDSFCALKSYNADLVFGEMENNKCISNNVEIDLNQEIKPLPVTQ